jgi:hypothetical protein
MRPALTFRGGKGGGGGAVGLSIGPIRPFIKACFTAKTNGFYPMENTLKHG